MNRNHRLYWTIQGMPLLRRLWLWLRHSCIPFIILQGVPLTYTPPPETKLGISAGFCGYYRKTYLFKFLCAKFQTSLMILDAFNWPYFEVAKIVKIEGKIHVFHEFFEKYICAADFLSNNFWFHLKTCCNYCFYSIRV